MQHANASEVFFIKFEQINEFDIILSLAPFTHKP